MDFDPEDIDGDDAWEEVDEFDRDPDMTVDLNDPRSQSGRYWKSEFQKYHGEARVEMEKLVKYKQLAKSYAKAKDAEALDLNQRLREEQAKVAEMERKVAEMTQEMSGKEGQSGGSRDDKRLLRDLAHQTALAVQYRKQVEELESLLKDSGYTVNSSRLRDTSLRSTQSRDLERLRQELQRVKSDLTRTEQRELQIQADKNKLAEELTKSTWKVEELERKLMRSEQECERKDKQLEKLKADLDALKEKDKVQREETAPLRRASRTSRPAVADVLRDGPDSTEYGAPAPWAKKLDDLQARLKDEQEARRRDMEDASVTIDCLREEYKTIASEFRSPATRKRRSDLRSKSEGKLSMLDNYTTEIMPTRSLGTRKHTNVVVRPTTRGSKRTASGRILAGVEKADEKPASSIRLRRLRTIKEELQKNSPRRQSRPALQESKHQDTTEKDAPLVTDEGRSRTMLSSERRAAAIARLEQKRAERRRAQGGNSLPGKENAGLYEDFD